MRLLKQSGKRAILPTFNLGMELARSRDPKDRESAAKLADVLAELCLQSSSPMDHPRAAGLLSVVGKHRRAQELLSATLDAMEENPTMRGISGLRSRTAIALAPYDLEQSQRFWSRLKRDYDRTQGWCRDGLHGFTVRSG